MSYKTKYSKFAFKEIYHHTYFAFCGSASDGLAPIALRAAVMPIPAACGLDLKYHEFFFVGRPCEHL